VTGGLVYVGSSTGVVAALDASNGTTRWSVEGVWDNNSSPAVAKGVVYVGSAYGQSGRIYAIRAGTGKVLWSTSTGDAVESSPAVANGVVYVGCLNHDVYAVDASTGSILWSYTTGSDVVSSPAVANGRVYVGSSYPDGTLYAFGSVNGRQG